MKPSMSFLSKVFRLFGSEKLYILFGLIRFFVSGWGNLKLVGGFQPGWASTLKLPRGCHRVGRSPSMKLPMQRQVLSADKHDRDTEWTEINGVQKENRLSISSSWTANYQIMEEVSKRISRTHYGSYDIKKM